MEKEETNDKSKSDQLTKPKKRSILDTSPMQRRVFEKMGMIYKVEKNKDDNSNKS